MMIAIEKLRLVGADLSVRPAGEEGAHKGAPLQIRKKDGCQ